jgi:hypothetical protein
MHIVFVFTNIPHNLNHYLIALQPMKDYWLSSREREKRKEGPWKTRVMIFSFFLIYAIAVVLSRVALVDTVTFSATTGSTTTGAAATTGTS